MSIPIVSGFHISSPSHIDDRYSNNGQPYSTTASAIAAIPNYRYIGLTVLVAGNLDNPYPQEYWWQNGVTNNDLILKVPSSSNSGQSILGSASGGNITYWTGTYSIGGSSNLTWDNNVLRINSLIGTYSLQTTKSVLVGGNVLVSNMYNLTSPYGESTISDINNINYISGFNVEYTGIYDPIAISGDSGIDYELEIIELFSDPGLTQPYTLPSYVTGNIKVHFNWDSDGATTTSVTTYINVLNNNYNFDAPFYFGVTNLNEYANDIGSAGVIISSILSKSIYNTYYNVSTKELMYSNLYDSQYLSGNGQNNYITYWNGNNSLTYSSKLYWNNTVNGLLIGTNSSKGTFSLQVNGDSYIQGNAKITGYIQMPSNSTPTTGTSSLQLYASLSSAGTYDTLTYTGRDGKTFNIGNSVFITVLNYGSYSLAPNTVISMDSSGRIVKASPDTYQNQLLGITVDSISVNGYGRYVSMGVFRNINVYSYGLGTKLYVDYNGGLTSSPPVGYPAQCIGVVGSTGTLNTPDGSILINPNGAYTPNWSNNVNDIFNNNSGNVLIGYSQSVGSYSLQVSGNAYISSNLLIGYTQSQLVSNLQGNGGAYISSNLLINVLPTTSYVGTNNPASYSLSILGSSNQNPITVINTGSGNHINFGRSSTQNSTALYSNGGASKAFNFVNMSSSSLLSGYGGLNIQNTNSSSLNSSSLSISLIPNSGTVSIFNTKYNSYPLLQMSIKALNSSFPINSVIDTEYSYTNPQLYTLGSASNYGNVILGQSGLIMLDNATQSTSGFRWTTMTNGGLYEVMRLQGFIGGGGQLLIGLTQSQGTYSLQVSGGSYITGFSYFSSNIGCSGSINVSGNITATNGGFDSDKRLKSDIVYNPVIEGIDSIKSASYIIGGNSHIGYIAQDVENIVPSSIIKKDDGYLALNYNEVLVAKVAFLENKVKELSDIIERNGLK